MSKPSFRRALLDADRGLAATALPAARDREIRAALVRGRGGRGVPWRQLALASAVAIACLVAFAVALRAGSSHEPARTVQVPRPGTAVPVPPATTVAGFIVTAPPAAWRVTADGLEVVADSLVLEAAGFGSVVGQRGAIVARVGDGVRVVRGHVEIAVVHRGAGAPPALVHVSHGTIAVLGTRFTIDQDATGGRVALHEGKIRFTSGTRAIDLVPGETLAWPLAAPRPAGPQGHVTAAPEPPPASEAPAPAVADVDAVLAELARLRAEGRFADASALLERTLGEPLPAATLERLSFELGEIESYQLADRVRACRHWRAHAERYPDGRYREEVAAATRRLDCKEITP